MPPTSNVMSNPPEVPPSLEDDSELLDVPEESLEELREDLFMEYFDAMIKKHPEFMKLMSRPTLEDTDYREVISSDEDKEDALKAEVLAAEEAQFPYHPECAFKYIASVQGRT